MDGRGFGAFAAAHGIKSAETPGRKGGSARGRGRGGVSALEALVASHSVPAPLPDAEQQHKQQSQKQSQKHSEKQSEKQPRTQTQTQKQLGGNADGAGARKNSGRGKGKGGGGKGGGQGGSCSSYPIAQVLDNLALIPDLEQRIEDSGASSSFAPPLSPEARQKLKAELRKVNVSKDSYVEPKLRDCDAQGFMAAGVMLWIWDDNDGVNILMALEQRKPGQEPLLNFIGGKRDALSESARETAAREATEETGGLLSASTRAAILNAPGPVLWHSRGKYVVFVVEAAAEDGNLPRRL